MTQFYYEQNGQRIGPILIEDIKHLQISGETLVWFEGLLAWTKAEEISEFADYLKKIPPPLPPRNKIKSDSIYDLTYEKESDAEIAGILLLAIPFGIRLSGMLTFEDLENYNKAYAILTIVALITRIVVTIWVINIAKRQNRNITTWGFFTFFLPGIALISIGLLRRLKIEGQPSFAELKKELEKDWRTDEQKIIDNKRSNRQDKILRATIFFIVIFAIAALFTLMYFWK